jgi:hypothetical protein
MACRRSPVRARLAPLEGPRKCIRPGLLGRSGLLGQLRRVPDLRHLVSGEPPAARRLQMPRRAGRPPRVAEPAAVVGRHAAGTAARSAARRVHDRLAEVPNAEVVPDRGSDAVEGVGIFDVSDPAHPSLVKGVDTDCGSHTHARAGPGAQPPCSLRGRMDRRTGDDATTGRRRPSRWQHRRLSD